jgi:O-antigen ligase
MQELREGAFSRMSVLSRKSRALRARLVATCCGLAGGGSLLIAASQVSPLVAGAAMLGMLVAIAIVLSPVLGVLLTSAVIPMERIGRLSADSQAYTVSLMRIIGLIALISFILHAAVKRWKLYFGEALAIYGIYCFLGLLTIFYTSDHLGTVRAGSAIIGNLVFFFLIINTVRTWKLAKRVLIVWLVSSVAIGIYTVYDWHSGRAVNVQRIGELQSRFSTVYSDTAEWQDLESLSRAVGPTSSAAVYGINMILTLPFFAYLIRVERDVRLRVALFLGLGIVVYNIFLSNTRAAILLTVAVSAMCLARRLIVITGTRALAVVALTLVVFVAAPTAVYERILKLSNYSSEHSLTMRARFDYWKAGLIVAEDHWLGGAGLGNQNEIPKYLTGWHPEQTSVHNEYLQTLDEVGILGWTVFFSFIGLLLWYSFRAAAIFKKLPEGSDQYWFMVAAQIAMIGTLLYGLQVDVFHFPLKGWWLVASLTWVAYQLGRKQAADFEQTRVLEAQP